MAFKQGQSLALDQARAEGAYAARGDSASSAARQNAAGDAGRERGGDLPADKPRTLICLRCQRQEHPAERRRRFFDPLLAAGDGADEGPALHPRSSELRRVIFRRRHHLRFERRHAIHRGMRAGLLAPGQPAGRRMAERADDPGHLHQTSPTGRHATPAGHFQWYNIGAAGGRRLPSPDLGGRQPGDGYPV